MTLAGRQLSRGLLALAILAALVGVAPPALATSAGVRSTAAPATAYIGSTVVVSGLVTPHKAATLTVERLVGSTWKPLVRTKSGKTGLFSVTLRAPAKPVTWALRVVGHQVSATLHVHVVKAVFVVRAAAPTPVVVGSPVEVTGSVSPKAGGTVWLQLLQGNAWHNLSSTKLSAKGTFVLQHNEPAGSYRLRVSKTFSTAVAAGTSPAFTVVVVAPPVVASPPGPLAITTTAPAGGNRRPGLQRHPRRNGWHGPVRVECHGSAGRADPEPGRGHRRSAGRTGDVVGHRHGGGRR